MKKQKNISFQKYIFLHRKYLCHKQNMNLSKYIFIQQKKNLWS